MRKYITYVTTTLLLFLALSCAKEPMPSAASTDVHQDGCQVRLSFSVEGEDGVRSAIGSEAFLSGWEKEIKDVMVLQYVRYDGGSKDSLWMSYYFSDPSKAEVLMMEGRTYEFCVLANAGDRRGQVRPYGNTSAVLKDFVVQFKDFVTDIRESGVPMSGRKVVAWDGKADMEFTLERLLAKVNFRFLNSSSNGRLALEHGTFVATSLTLRDANTLYEPFNETLGMWCWETGDNASSFGNMQSINKGESVPFYCLPNNFFKPLPEGARMSDRTPENFYKYNPDYQCPTYVEVVGDYTDGTGELHAATTMRLYLGETPESFNVFGNSVLNLNVTLTDVHGYLESNWRLEPVVTDNRTLAFLDELVRVIKNEPKKVDILCNGKKASADNATYKALGLAFTLSDNLKAAGVSFDAATRTLALASNPATDITGTLTATSWDGRQTASITVVAMHGIDVGGDDSGGTGGGEIYY